MIFIYLKFNKMKIPKMISKIKISDLSESNIKRIRKAQNSGKEGYVHLLSNGKIGIWWKLVIPSKNTEIISVSRIQDIIL